ncbi:hypothetical protein CY35_11G095600 [Sphagnum magellanicum]|nr:hypothetical protein CY35_11G095600 [Sphagnum magellanicum]KAH9548589.1 hypothetical protein CY35_11G095600 [Sphagnum magellanicum]KAH9548590.1 hypothetical protein CY35_11G095600 [Sphagnum magellanicum]KAH9548591.1 hypothetical protein CY35_11G095600 [Sphagnum magellanicum]
MDEATYWARVQRVFNMMDIRTAFVTDSQVDAALELLKSHEDTSISVSLEELEKARKIKDAVVHPDTGEKIFLPLRLSFIIPCNLVLDTLMISARGYAQNVGAQWLNQTYNCLHYYANRNASNEEAGRRILEAYVGATASSVGAVVGLHALLDRVPSGNRWAPLARRLVPFGAVAAADVLNLGITRRDEFLEGIKVFDSHGNEVGQSRLAGARAVSACIAGRIAAAAPILVIPPLVMHRLERAQFYIKRPYLRLPTLIAMLGASIQISVPLCFGIFKQQASVDVVKLESSFHNRVDRFGQPINQVSFNKGI